MYSPITGHIEIDRAQRSVRKDGQDVHLTGLEYNLLSFLTNHPNRICSRQELLDHVWGDRFKYDTGTLDVHLNALRQKLGWDRKSPVEAIRGVGLIFRLKQPVPRYTIDLQSFLTRWLQSREMELRAQGLVAQLHLTPFVNDITIEPSALQQMLDGILSALLPAAQPGVLRLSSRLTMQSFILTLDINGTTNELRIPLEA